MPLVLQKPEIIFGVNTTSYMPVPRALLGVTHCCLYACCKHDDSQGTELNYPYLLYNERVNFSKLYTITTRPKLAFHRENSPFDEELDFFKDGRQSWH